MSILVYKGDTTDNFGQFLPVPYIEKIEIHDEGTYQIYLALFMIVDEDEDVNSVLNRLMEVDDNGNQLLTNYILISINKPEDGITNLLSGEKNVFGYYKQSLGTDSLTSRTILETINLFNASVTDDFYDINGNRVLKFTLCYGCEGTAGSTAVFPGIDGTGGLPPNPHLPGTDTPPDVTGGGFVITNGATDDGGYEEPTDTGGEPPTTPSMDPIGDPMGTKGPSFDTGDDGGPSMDPIGDRFGYEEPEFAPQPDAMAEDLEHFFDAEPSEPGSDDPWNWVCDMWIFTFSSTFDYFNNEDEFHERLDNFPALFKKEISDIAYEPVFQNCELVDGLQSAFMDAEGSIYNGAVIKSLGNLYYKAESVTHDEISEFMNKLISEFNPGENTPLKKATGEISYILSVYDYSDDILKQLDIFRRAFPDKSGATETGRFYKRFEKRVLAINKKLKANPQVFKKIIRNSKILDLRDPDSPVFEPPDNFVTLYGARHDYYIYNSSWVDRTAIFTVVNDPTSTLQIGETSEGADPYDPSTWNYEGRGVTNPLQTDTDVVVRNFGYFMFDYEKALKKVAHVNKIIDVSKLESYGIPVPYEHFRVTHVSTTREEEDGNIVITSAFDNDKPYPITKTSNLENNSSPINYKNAILAPGFYDAPFVDFEDITLTTEQYTHLIFRNFEPLNLAPSISPTLPKYRLMAFQIQDFMDDDIVSYSGNYDVSVEIEDNSIDTLMAIIDEYRESLDAIKEYLNDIVAEQSLAYDEITGLFSEYLMNSVEAIYKDREYDAPYYRAPFLYSLFKDLFYNEYESPGDTLEASSLLSTNINPFNGSFYALEEFVADMEDFYNNNLISGTTIFDEISSIKMSSPSEKVFEVGTVEYTDDPNEIYGVMYLPS